MSARVEHVTCQQLVEALTGYLDGVVDAELRTDIERHIVFCRGCSAYVEQMRETIALVGRIAQDHPDDKQTGELLALFRRWQSEREPPG